MKILVVLLVGVGLFCAHHSDGIQESLRSLHQSLRGVDGVHGQYVEVRSAAVFAGSCHYNGEVDHQGRRALLGFQLEGGTWNDESLQGATLVVAVGGPSNLKDDGPRTSIVYVDEALACGQREAAVDWLRSRHGARLGEIARVEVVPVSLAVDERAYLLDVSGVARVEGEVLADDACCVMPESVWYEPLAGPADARVGFSTRCRFEGEEGIAAWTYEDQNNAFVGSFRDRAYCAPKPAPPPGCCPVEIDTDS